MEPESVIESAHEVERNDADQFSDPLDTNNSNLRLAGDCTGGADSTV